MPDEMREKITGQILNGFVSKLNEAGLDDDWEITRLKKEIAAKAAPKTVKLKGALSPLGLPKGWQFITTTGVVEREKDKKTGGIETYYGDGETLVSLPLEDMGIQQRARQDVQKLKGRFIERHHHEGSVAVPIKLDPKDREFFSQQAADIVNAIIKRHRSSEPTP